MSDPKPEGPTYLYSPSKALHNLACSYLSNLFSVYFLPVTLVYLLSLAEPTPFPDSAFGLAAHHVWNVLYPCC